MDIGEGERLHAERRKKFWKIIGGLMAIGMVAGFVSGFAVGYDDAGGGSNRPLLKTLGAAALVLSAVLACYGSWRYFASVDELEVADNLWGSLIGFYTYAFLLPTWWGLHWLERAPEVNHWIVYAASIATATAAYLFRKWRTF